MSGSQYLGQPARLRLLELGGRSPSYQNVWDDETENMRKRLLSGPTVDIRVGPERKHWSLHRNLLCHHSSYFETELRIDEKAEPNGTKHHNVDLPDDDPVGFELLVKWLYQGQLEDASQMSDEAKYDYAVACHKLHLLCDRFDMIRLKNLSMDQYRQCLNESQLVPDADEINEIYRASPVGSPFRSLMITIAARQIMDPEVNRNAEGYRKCFENNPDFAVEMVNAIRSMSGGILFEDPTRGNQCTYHNHDNSSGCQLEGKGKGKGKAKATKAGAVNDQGSPIENTDHTQNTDRMGAPLGKLPEERRTPRKLKTSRRSPAVMQLSASGTGTVVQPTPAVSSTKAPFVNSEHSRQTAHVNGRSATQANIRSPRVPAGVPLNLESRDAGKPTPASSKPPRSIARDALPLRAVSSGIGSSFDWTNAGPLAQHNSATRMPLVNNATFQQNLRIPPSMRDDDQGLAISVNGFAPNPAFVSPSLGKENRPLSRANLANLYVLDVDNEHHKVVSTARSIATANHNRRVNATHGSKGTDIDNGSTTSTKSRKRKMQDRTPKKARSHRPAAQAGLPGSAKTPSGAARPLLGRSSTSRSSTISHATSRTASIASGPRKLSRVSSVVKVRNGNGGTTSIDGKRRQPPKLRIHSQQT